MTRGWLAVISIYRPEMTNTFFGNPFLICTSADHPKAKLRPQA